ncbi:hypothetical protein KEJ51_07885 [Candidatus Bathyarchaeota archaeon]|nr:hypothetical protein [Candidatus Bathyarchaeota archaeon]MBS7629593.1 hypothetical protein [Candidatus Bathyarchaeota archaeon]
MANRSIGASIGYGILLFIILAIGFIMLATAIQPTMQPTKPTDLAGMLGNLVGTIISFAMSLMLIVFGPLEGLIVGSVLGIRHKGEPLRGFASSLVASLVGYVVMIIILLGWMATRLPSAPTGQPSLAGTQPILQESWRFILALGATTFTGAASGLIVSFSTKEKGIKSHNGIEEG